MRFDLGWLCLLGYWIDDEKSGILFSCIYHFSTVRICVQVAIFVCICMISTMDYCLCGTIGTDPGILNNLYLYDKYTWQLWFSNFRGNLFGLWLIWKLIRQCM